MSVYAIARAFAVAAMLLLTAACSDSTTEPGRGVPTSSLTIAPPSGTVYETDYVQFTATLRDPSGEPVPDAPIEWEVSDPSRAELQDGGGITALKSGAVTITARSNGASASYVLDIVKLTVQQVLVLPVQPELARGDIMSIGVKVEGQGGRLVTGRVVSLTSDDPSIVTVDAAGRLRAVDAGAVTIRATADGVTGTARVVVKAEPALFELTRRDGVRLPLLVASDSVLWDGVPELHETYMETGVLKLSGTAQPRYEIDVRYAEYKVTTVDGQRVLQLRLASREYDRGLVTFDARGDLQLVSEYTAPLSHTAMAVSNGIQVRFRVPGDDEILELFYRRDPQ